MERTNYLHAFSRFVFALAEQRSCGNAVDVFRWSVAQLTELVDADCSWAGWADLSQNEVQLCASFSCNLPSNYEQFWSAMRRDDILAQDVLRNRRSSAFYDRQGSRHTDGMVALSDSFFIDKLAVVVSEPGHGPVSMFMSPYRSGRRAHPLQPDAIDFLRCALDHVRNATSQCGSTSDQDGTLLVNAAGRILNASPNAVRLLGEHWPGWRRGYLPSELAEPLSPVRRRSLAERGIAVACQHLAHLPGQPLTSLTLRRAGPCDRMTARERQIASEIAAGRTHKEIATRLSLSPATVRNRTQAILAKAGVHSKAALSNLLASAPAG